MVQSFQFNKITENIYQILNKFLSACYITDKQFICPQILHYNEYLSKDGQRLQFLPFKHRCQPLVPRFQWCLRAEQKFSFTKLSLGLKCWVTNLTSDTNKIKIKIKNKKYCRQIPWRQQAVLLLSSWSLSLSLSSSLSSSSSCNMFEHVPI